MTTNKERLQNLRQRINQTTDADLAARMQDEWECGVIPDGNVSDDDLKHVRNRLYEAIGRQRTDRRSIVRSLLRVVQVAAAVMLPVCIIATVYFYRENRQMASIPMVEITTGDDEQATVTLPDGTRVTVNASSRLRYAPQTFSKDSREVFFDGEGYYKVARNERLPFVVHGHKMDVAVLGTEFNLLNRSVDATAEVALVNGSVRLTSLVSDRTCTMRPNDVAIVDKTTGRIDVRHNRQVTDAGAWTSRQMVFHDVALRDVVRNIEKRYGVNVRLDTAVTARFTGTLPTNNLSEALEIVAKTYSIKVNKTTDGRYVMK